MMRNISKFLLSIPSLLLILSIPYFVFVHPAIIYYGTNGPEAIHTPDGKEALLYLALSLILWGSVFGFTVWKIFKGGIGAKANVDYMKTSARRIPAVIKEAKNIKKLKTNWESKEVIFEIDNFSNEKIRHKMLINDSRPKEKRYEVGKIIYLRIDPEFKKYPYIFPEGVKTKVSYLPFLIWLFFFVGVIAYYYYAYIHENRGFGWRFLEFSHPLLVSPAVIIFFSGIIYIFFKIFATDKSSPEMLKLKFWGLQTNAKIIEAHQTGTYINEQPQVKFTVEFTDNKGILHQVSKTEIVSLMNIGNISAMKQREIIYMPNDPETFNFFDEIND